jgi:hypothetical protein
MGLIKKNKTTIEAGVIIGVIALGLAFVALNQAVSAKTIVQSGTVTTAMSIGNDVTNLATVTYPIPFKSLPTLTCCYFASGFSGLQINSLFWSTVFVPQQILNITSPFLDTFIRHDKNYVTCPCTDSVTVTPSFQDEIIVVHTYAVSDGQPNVISVTATGLIFTQHNPITPSSGLDIEMWTTTEFSTLPITITVTWTSGVSTLVTTGLVASVFGNTIGIGAISSQSTASTSPTIVSIIPQRQYSVIVGDWIGSNATLGCSDPTPGSGQTQIVNDNTFCHTNINGGLGFLYNYDAEYKNLQAQTSYNYITNFNSTVTTGGSIAIELFSMPHHDKLWQITSTNSTLYDSEQYNTALNPPFQSQAGVGQSNSGTFNIACNYTNENVSITISLEAFSGGQWLFTYNISPNQYSGNLCDGTIHSFNIQNTYGLSNQLLGRIRAQCTVPCSTPLLISISNLFIAWHMVGQQSLNFQISAQSVTGFQVRWLASFPAGNGYSIVWTWSALL